MKKVGILFGDRMITLGGKGLNGSFGGQECRITVQKNQLSKPYSEAYVSFMYDIGMI